VPVRDWGCGSGSSLTHTGQRRDLRKGGGIGNLVCVALPSLGVQEGSHLQDPLGELFGLSEGRDGVTGQGGPALEQRRSYRWGLDLHGLHHLG
jgi:hypothetical protein